jgi:phosphoglucan,water dikinase
MTGRRNIRIGNQTAYIAATPIEPFTYAVENGFDAFEWFPDKKETGAGWEVSDLDDTLRRDIRETARAHDIALTVHVPWWAHPMMQGAATLFAEQVDFAVSIGAILLNVHLDASAGLSAYIRALVPLIKLCRQAGLRLALENTPLTTPEDFNRLFVLLQDVQDVGTEHVGMCFDLGHANLCAGTRNDYIGFLDRLDSRVRLCHMHLHENYGDADSHLPLFTGPAGQNEAGILALVDRLKKRGYQGALILENWPAPPMLLNEAREKLRRMFGDYAGKQEGLSVADQQKVRQQRVLEAGEQDQDLEGKSSFAEAEPFTNDLVAMDRKCRSWRQKLDGINTLLQEKTFQSTNDNLAYLSVYLRFLGTGEIACTEDGRHFRPSHHARLSRQIQERLLALATPDNIFILRKIFPWLPSFDRTFTRAEPLTRIRDIAHRNDISSGLKKEIKQTLQNKLHRCAGPEDLATSAAMLKRITAIPGEYPPPFVHEFKIFHTELQDFFNARPLEDQLEALIAHENGELAADSRRFLAAKKKSARNAAHQFERLQLATALREGIGRRLDNKATTRGQNLRLADNGLEEYVFVRTSALITSMAPAGRFSWKLPLTTLDLVVTNLRLSGMEPDECNAIVSELAAWGHNFAPSARLELLRLKATLARCRRLVDAYSDLILALFFNKAHRLGHALGVADHAIRMYCEGDIRGNLVFQLAKLVALLLRQVRKAAALPPWEVLVPGRARALLVAAPNLSAVTAAPDEKMLVLLDKAEGDETVPPGVAGIILTHALPHLSHLAIRIRQEGAVLVVSEDTEQLTPLRHWIGKYLMLDATADTVIVDSDFAAPVPPDKRPAAQVIVPDVDLNSSSQVLELSQVTISNSGAKATGVRRLHEISRQQGAGFRCPRAMAVPFGVLAAAIDAAPERKRYQDLLHSLEHASADAFESTVRELGHLAAGLPVPEEIADMVCKEFGAARLMVRSSASCEDLERMAGAGLYESYANIAPGQVAEGVRQVWASLWTDRAARSRQQAGIPHAKAHMAVLIQQMIEPDYSFVMHSINPVSLHRHEIYVELAVGLGETLARSATRGTPYRMVCDKRTGRMDMLAFADFSKALWPVAAGNIVAERVDYAKVALSIDGELRKRLGQRLAAIGRYVEQSFGHPQDIEGVIAGNDIWLVQARPQQGI